jgi:hypothetical protein
VPDVRALALLLLAGLAACTPPPRMCAQESDCGAQASCVAGRCVAHGATAAVDTARRLLFEPVDVGHVRRGDAGDRAATDATLGRAGEPTVTLLRFALSLPPEANVVEAYLLLERDESVDADPAPLALHAARVSQRWDARSLTWANQPRIEEVGAPVTRVDPRGGPLVRLDVREIVRAWRKRSGEDFGVALVVDGESATGLAFALAPRRAGRPGTPGDGAVAPVAGPRLELYVR